MMTVSGAGRRAIFRIELKPGFHMASARIDLVNDIPIFSSDEELDC